MGDFNEALNKSLDRFPPGVQSHNIAEGRLGQFLVEAGLFDVWRVRNPHKRQYSCFLASYSTLSRIDMILGNAELLPLVGDVVYLPRGVLDHSLVVVSVNIGGKEPQ